MTSPTYPTARPSWAISAPAPHPALRGAQLFTVLSVLLAGPIGLVLAGLALRRVGAIRRDIDASGGRWDGESTARALRIAAWLGVVLSVLMTLWGAAQLLVPPPPPA